MSGDKNLIRKLNSVGLMQKTMGGYFTRLKEAAESPDRKVAWCTSVGPAELLYSFGFEVHFPENHSAIIGSAKVAEKYIPIAVAHGYSPEVCSYMTSDIGAFLKGETPLSKFGFNSVPKPDILVYNTNQCRDVQDWFTFYARHFNVPIVGISTPLGVNEVTKETIQYVSKQFQDIVPKLEEVSGNKFDIERFKEAIELSHDACVLWREVLETAKNHPAPINFFDSSIHMGPVVVMRGTKPAVSYYKALLSELKDRIKDNIGAIPDEKYRLYWEGMPMWFKLSSMAKLFAGLNACIVASTYCNSWVFDDLDPDNPFDSSALAYTKLFIARSDAVKEEMLVKLFKDYSVDGIIYHEAKTCPRNSNNRSGLHVQLNRRTKIPYLEIQGDLNDSRCYSEEQGRIAIETFISQLEMRK